MRRLLFEACEDRHLLAVNLVADLNATPQSSSPSDFVAIGDEVFFAADIRDDVGFFKTDGQSVTSVDALPTSPNLSDPSAFFTPFGTFSIVDRTEVVGDMATTRHLLVGLHPDGEAIELHAFGTTIKNGDTIQTEGNVTLNC